MKKNLQKLGKIYIGLFTAFFKTKIKLVAFVVCKIEDWRESVHQNLTLQCQLFHKNYFHALRDKNFMKYICLLF